MQVCPISPPFVILDALIQLYVCVWSGPLFNNAVQFLSKLTFTSSVPRDGSKIMFKKEHREIIKELNQHIF